MARALIVRSKEALARPELANLDLRDFPDHPVTVRISHSSLNYKDALALTGKSPVIRRFPMVPGIDLTGVVEEDRSGTFQSGEAVLATGYGLGEAHWGGYAEIARLQPEWLVRRPERLTAKQSMGVGTAGLTAMLCVQALQEHGATPAQGPVLVTGAAGGVGSLAVAFLAKAGFAVIAATGRPSEAGFLRDLGASDILDRSALLGEPKPLAKEQWAAAIDVAGGTILANVLSAVRYGGVVAACGLAQSMNLPTTVAPFILRGATLIGIDSVMAAAARRLRAWERIDRDLDRDKLDALTSHHTLDDVVRLGPLFLDGKVRGRIIVEV